MATRIEIQELERSNRLFKFGVAALFIFGAGALMLPLLMLT